MEEPRVEIGEPFEGFTVTDGAPGVTVARLLLRSDARTFWQRIDETRDGRGGQPFDVSPDITRASLMFESRYQPRLQHDVARFVAEWRAGPLALWLYTPLVVDFVDALSPDVVVYDVMDDLSAFRFAQPTLRDREERLLSRADVVFAGGPTLHRATASRRPDAHLFPSGVDVAHFARALDPETEIPDDVARLTEPVVTYIGVIDERIDLDLLDRAARLRPAWSWVLVGPVLKVRESALPRLPNVSFLGQRSYSSLPGYLRGSDVAMMPFATGEATRSISPTKTLEYLAAGRPVVSTPVPDVVELYGSAVRVAVTPEAFVAEVTAAVAARDAGDAQLLDVDEMLERYSW
ncbi:MAG: glycosyltransferase, partial [Chloroflexota bacterium]|nr:glycosyltransferase [Chloroflexota bacterium]